MPFRLRISNEEVKKELEKMGFEDFPDEAVESFRKDLLKLIKDDLRQVKSKRQQTAFVDDLPTELVYRYDQRGDTHGPFTSTPLVQPRETAFTHEHYKHKDDNKSPSQSTCTSEDESGYSENDSNLLEGSPDPSSSVKAISTNSGYSSAYSSRATLTPTPSGSYSASDTAASLEHPGVSRYVYKQQFLEPPTRDNLIAPKSRGAGAIARHHHKPWSSTTTSVTQPSKDHHKPWSSTTTSVTQPSKDQHKSSKTKHDKKEDLPSYPKKADPVNLYHFYRAHWDKFKVPGEDPRTNLRWDIRTKLFYSNQKL